mgnify:CR=1 FL=1
MELHLQISQQRIWKFTSGRYLSAIYGKMKKNAGYRGYFRISIRMERWNIHIEKEIVNNLTKFLGENNVKVVKKSIEKKP